VSMKPQDKDALHTFNANGHPFKVTYGNLIELAKKGHFDVIAHGCNCHCVMGAGIAKTIRDTWPEAYAADCATKKSDRSKMGTYSSAQIGDLTILNLYTQYNYTRSKVDVEYESVEKCFRLIKENFSGKRIGLPMIGAGLAGGSWGLIKEIIGNTLQGEDVTVVVFKDVPDVEPPVVEDKPQW